MKTVPLSPLLAQWLCQDIQRVLLLWEEAQHDVSPASLLAIPPKSPTRSRINDRVEQRPLHTQGHTHTHLSAGVRLTGFLGTSVSVPLFVLYRKYDFHGGGKKKTSRSTDLLPLPGWFECFYSTAASYSSPKCCFSTSATSASTDAHRHTLATIHLGAQVRLIRKKIKKIAFIERNPPSRPGSSTR